MNFKRIITGLIGFPIVACIIIFENKYVIDFLFSIISAMSLYEYNKALKLEKNPVTWIGYVACGLISFMHLIPLQYLPYAIGIIIPVMVLLMFLHIIFSKMKTNIVDIAKTFFGIFYIVVFLAFIPLLMGGENGKRLIFYILFAGWGTDTFAYFTGRWFGKHKLCEISPKKTIEGSIGGVIGAVILVLIHTAVLNNFYGMNINYLIVLCIGIILSLLGQIGDLAASTIKRYAEIKDYGNLLPGHGGMLDRIDSIIFIAPFAYFLLMLI